MADLDARAAGTVMHVVRNIADTGRTVVCTIHQPSTNIFEVGGQSLGPNLKICMLGMLGD